MIRLPDWEARLIAYLDQLVRVPYDAVANNCGGLAAGAIEAVTGDDAFALLGIDRPASEIAAARLLVERGGVRGLAEALIGVPADPGVLQARRGDLVIASASPELVIGEDRETLGVADGAGATFVTPTGLFSAPLTACTGFWRVGE